jgi:post-segregation antitoxin (ccd killing protein)
VSEKRTKREATSIKIDPNLWKEAKIEAIRRDMEVSELVELSLKKELKTPRKNAETADS